MEINEAIAFKPLFFERVWGGRRLEDLLDKPLPSGAPIGESWEIVDREEAQSVVQGGPLDGKPLHELWTDYRAEVFGEAYERAGGRFPLLVKLLDAREKLSVQVHPPAGVAPRLGGEPKTEMWHIIDCDQGASIYAGLRRGVGRREFARSLEDGTVEALIHRVPVAAGATMFIPSGRVHAIGAGNVILEVQQNSDTTYRVFDWNRTGLDGKPRELHIGESMQSIDFEDTEPGLEPAGRELLVSDPLFRVERWELAEPRAAGGGGRFAILACLEGVVCCGGGDFRPGSFFLVPAAMGNPAVAPGGGCDHAVVVRITLP